MDDDDEIFNVVSKPVETKQPVPSNGFDSGLGGFSFETGSAPVVQQPRQNDDPFNILGLEMPTNTPPSVTTQGSLAGGDLLGFGM